jgi:NAD(P)-dependent dehydrogenase (short-subunit alcohol dehydrogenase family)
MVRGMAIDLAPVRVNLVSPGAVVTELWDKMGMGEEKTQAMLVEMGKQTATGRVGRVEDVAESYLYLMKDQNITGAMISTSGGHLLKG